MSPQYEPIIADTRMSDYGYWVVTISVKPWQRLSVMICSVGITREQAGTDALATISGIPVRKVHS
jgi:hypothetical protein